MWHEIRKSAAVFLLLATLAGNGWAGPLEPGMTAWTSGRHSEALELWRPLAEKGHGTAALFLGFAYRYGIGADSDAGTAADWYRMAAMQGIPEAQYQLGLLYELGEGVPKNQAEADYWYARAVGQGFCPGELPAGGALGDS